MVSSEKCSVCREVTVYSFVNRIITVLLSFVMGAKHDFQYRNMLSTRRKSGVRVVTLRAVVSDDRVGRSCL